MKWIKLFFFIIGLNYSSSIKAQYFDGFLDVVGKLGYETGATSYGIISGETGVSKYLSLGLNLKYLLSSRSDLGMNSTLDEDGKIGYSLRADIHAHNIVDLAKSDILLGYNYKHGTSGVHIEYRYFISEFFGFYGRSKYHFDYPRITVLSDNSFLESKLRFEVGIIFKTISGNSYNNEDW